MMFGIHDPHGPSAPTRARSYRARLVDRVSLPRVSTSTFRATTFTLRWRLPVPSRPSMSWPTAIAAWQHAAGVLPFNSSGPRYLKGPRPERV
jgi:hypothetical protein